MERNCAIDIAKYIAAILVIGIHTHPFKEISGVMDFFTADVICRLAVPFFAVCTGYYLSIGLLFDKGGRLIGNKHNRGIVKRVLIKIGILYLGWSLFYFCVHLYSWYDSGSPIVYYSIGWIKSLFFSASYFHLWYLVSLLYAIIPFYLVLRYVKFKYVPLVACVLWLVECLEYAYRLFLPAGLQDLFAIYDMFGAVGPGITRMLPLLLIGVVIAKGVNKNVITKLGVLFVITLIAEAVLLDRLDTRHSFIVFTLPVAYVLFIAIYKRGRNITIKNSRYFAKISMVVYCLHPFIIWVLKNIGVVNPMILFIFTVVITTILSLLYYWSKKRIISYRINGSQYNNSDI